MIEFPNNTIISVPDHIFLKGQSFVTIRITSPSTDIEELINTYGKRLYKFEINFNLCHSASFLESLSGTLVDINISDDTQENCWEHMPLLKQLKSVFFIHSQRGLIRKINFLTSLNFPLHIKTDLLVENADALKSALDFYLHSPLLTVPIEPFHTLLQLEANNKGGPLWDIERERFGSHFYISDNGNITLSPRWNDKGLYFGTLENEWSEITQSDLFHQLSSYKENLFKKQSPCIFCNYFKFCQGYLVALNPDNSCDDWKTVFEIIEEEVKKSKSILKGYNEKSYE